jgi:hypothetical protein
MLTSTLLTLLLTALPLTTAITFPTLERRQETPANSTCPAQQAELEACGAALQPQVDLCTNNNQGPIDYCCLCSTYTQKLACFDTCPNDPERNQVNKQLDFYCAAAVDPCQADCLTGLVGMVGACGQEATDACMCETYNVTLECFAGCPLAAPNPGAEADRDGFCSRAASSSSVVPTPTPVSACTAVRATITSSAYTA